MRITDVIARYAEEGSTVLELTSEDCGLAGWAATSPGLRLRRVAAIPAGDERPGHVVLLQQLPVPASAADVSRLLNVHGAGERVVNLLLFARLEALLETGLLEEATRAGWELDETFSTGHRILRHAAAFVRASSSLAQGHLRARNEYRWLKLLLRVRDREVESLAARCARLQVELDQREKQRRSEGASIVQELASLRSSQQRLARERDDARRSMAELRERAALLEHQLDLTHGKMVTARTSLSFRIGRATRLAVQARSANPFAYPARWLRAFREPCGIPPGLRPLPQKSTAVSTSDPLSDRAATARRHLLDGLERVPGTGPLLAGIVCPRLATELAASARFRLLGPSSWPHLLDDERPAWVLVTADGLEPGTPWHDFGTPEGRGGKEALLDLAATCRSLHVPIVYWDTEGRPEPRLGAPSGVSFDAIFSVSPRACEDGVSTGPLRRLLPPAVEPLVYNPTGVLPTPPSHPVYAGSFDRRLDRSELEALENILRAAAGRGLRILWSDWRAQGPLAAALRMPEDLSRLCCQRPPVAGEVRAVGAAGLLLCGHTAPGADFVPWQLVRGIAEGAHVLATPADLHDPTLEAGVAFARDPATAEAALDDLLGRPRLGPSWRSAFERVLCAHSLRDRLDEIARACGAARVTRPAPSLAVVAQVRSDGDLAGLRRFLASQGSRDQTVFLFVGDLSDPARALAGTVAPEALHSLPAGSACIPVDRIDSSHLLLWDPSLIAEPHAAQELLALARLSDADVLALSRGDGGGEPLYRYGEAAGVHVVAVRRDLAVRLDARAVSDPARTLRTLVMHGARVYASEFPVRQGVPGGSP